MKKALYIFCIFALACAARENPFAPLGELNSSVMTSNEKDSYEAFKAQDIKFPNDTNVLLGITIKYRADDGSIKEKVISDINKTIDKSQDYVLAPDNSNLDVSVTKPAQNINLNGNETQEVKGEPQSILDKELKMQPVAINDANLVALEPTNTQASQKSENKDEENDSKPVQISIREALALPQQVEQNTTQSPKTPAKTTQKAAEKRSGFDVKLASKQVKNSTHTIKILHFELGEKSLNIITKDKNIKHFVAAEKNKIVLDFAAATPAFDTKSLGLGAPVFKSVTVGWHKGYYRVAITLDKARAYSVSRVSGGYQLKVK